MDRSDSDRFSHGFFLLYQKAPHSKYFFDQRSFELPNGREDKIRQRLIVAPLAQRILHYSFTAKNVWIRHCGISFSLRLPRYIIA